MKLVLLITCLTFVSGQLVKELSTRLSNMYLLTKKNKLQYFIDRLTEG